MLDVISVDKEVAGGAPAVGAPVAAGLGAAREGGGISPAAAPTTPGAQGEVRRTPSGPSSVEAERERLQRARETTTAATDLQIGVTTGRLRSGTDGHPARKAILVGSWKPKRR